MVSAILRCGAVVVLCALITHATDLDIGRTDESIRIDGLLAGMDSNVDFQRVVHGVASAKAASPSLQGRGSRALLGRGKGKTATKKPKSHRERIEEAVPVINFKCSSYDSKQSTWVVRRPQGKGDTNKCKVAEETRDSASSRTLLGRGKACVKKGCKTRRRAPVRAVSDPFVLAMIAQGPSTDESCMVTMIHDTKLIPLSGSSKELGEAFFRRRKAEKQKSGSDEVKKQKTGAFIYVEYVKVSVCKNKKSLPGIRRKSTAHEKKKSSAGLPGRFKKLKQRESKVIAETNELSKKRGELSSKQRVLKRVNKKSVVKTCPKCKAGNLLRHGAKGPSAEGKKEKLASLPAATGISCVTKHGERADCSRDPQVLKSAIRLLKNAGYTVNNKLLGSSGECETKHEELADCSRATHRLEESTLTVKSSNEDSVPGDGTLYRKGRRLTMQKAGLDEQDDDHEYEKQASLLGETDMVDDLEHTLATQAVKRRKRRTRRIRRRRRTRRIRRRRRTRPKGRLYKEILKYQKDKHLPNTYGNMKCVVQKIIIHTETRRYYKEGKFDLELGEASNTNTIAELESAAKWRRRRRRSAAQQKAVLLKKQKEKNVQDVAMPDCVKLCVAGKDHKPVSKGKNRGRRLLEARRKRRRRPRRKRRRRPRRKRRRRPTIQRKKKGPKIQKVQGHGQYCIRVQPSWKWHTSQTEEGKTKKRRFLVWQASVTNPATELGEGALTHMSHQDKIRMAKGRIDPQAEKRCGLIHEDIKFKEKCMIEKAFKSEIDTLGAMVV